MKYIIAVLALCSFLFAWDKAFGETITTGNILTNSTFGTGTTYSTTGWTVDEHTHGHHGTGSFGTLGGGNNPGGSVAAEENTSIKQTVTLSEKTNMTVQEIQNGWSSTLGADIWYWNQYDNTTTLKQTITGSDGSVSTQQRVIQDTGCGSINCGSFTNYTDTHIQGSNTQTDFDIEVSVTNTNNRTGHWGPDIDDITLGINYTYINPLDEGTQDVIDDLDDTIDDAVDDIDWEEDYTFDDSWYEEEYTWYEENYSWEDDFYFEEEYDTSFDEGTSFEEFEMEEFDEIAFEEFEIEEFEMENFETFEEMPVLEEVFFEEDFTETPMMEEIFEEEFEEEFADFLEETGMEEEFMEFLEEEGITAEEFFEEVIEESFEEESDFVEPTEEALDEEITDDNMEEPTEVVAEESETEESSFEVASNEEETMEESPSNDGELEEDDGQVSEEPNEESEPNSETSDESDISSTDEDEQEDVQPEEDKDIKGGDFKGKVDIAKFEKKLKKDIKKLVQQVKASTQNLSKEDIFFKSNNNLNAYLKTDFYKPKDIYTDQNLDLFNQIDLGVYDRDIYTTVTLASYVNNDPVEKHNRELQEIKTKKQQLLLELEALKNE